MNVRWRQFWDKDFILFFALILSLLLPGEKEEFATPFVTKEEVNSLGLYDRLRFLSPWGEAQYMIVFPFDPFKTKGTLGDRGRYTAALKGRLLQNKGKSILRWRFISGIMPWEGP